MGLKGEAHQLRFGGASPLSPMITVGREWSEGEQIADGCWSPPVVCRLASLGRRQTASILHMADGRRIDAPRLQSILGGYNVPLGGFYAFRPRDWPERAPAAPLSAARYTRASRPRQIESSNELGSESPRSSFHVCFIDN